MGFKNKRYVAPRWLRRLLTIFIAIFTLIGLVSSYLFFNSAPRVGYFRSASGRSHYISEYNEVFKTLPKPQKIHDLVTDFGIVRAYEWNAIDTADSTPVVLVPGRSSGTPMWGDNLEFLVKTHHVIAFDSLGDAGLSVQTAPIVNLSDVAEWMDQAITQLAPQGAHVVGHSFGGAIAAAYAQRYPQHTKTLVLLEPVFTFGYPQIGVMSWVILASIPGLPKSWREKALGHIGGTDFAEDNALGRMIEVAAAQYSSSIPTPKPLTKTDAGQLRMPVYVALASTDSVAGGQKAAKRAAELIPHAQVQIWPETTHSLPMQVAEPLSQDLDKFWDSATN